MICGSCRRRCDPNRSFCTNCGSSVFIEERDVASFFGAPAPQAAPVSAESNPLQALKRAAASLDRTAVVKNAEKLRARKGRQAVAGQAVRSFALVRLIRFAIFGFLVWYAAGWLLRIAEVSALKDAILSGAVSDDVVRAAGDAVRARLDGALGGSQAPTGAPQSTPADNARTAPVARTAEAPAPSERPAADVVLRAPDNAELPPGVSMPVDDVTLPRVLQQVQPAYTPEALRAKIEGTVILEAVVRTHGVASNITVARSLDDRFGLDQQAIAAVRQWRFAPGQRRGQPVPVLVQIAITFAIK